MQAGSALDGGVMFASRKYYAIARYPKNSRLDRLKAKTGQVELKDENELEIVSGRTDPPPGGRFLSYVPIIGSIIGLIMSLFSKGGREPWKTIRNTEDAPTMARLGGFLIVGVVYGVLAGFSYLVGSWFAGLFGITEGTFWYGFLVSLMIPVVLCSSIILVAHFIQGDLLNFHGGEHKVGNAYRKGLPLTYENVMAQSKHHTNCSTNLLINGCIAFPFVIAFLYSWLNSFILAIVIGVIVESVVSVEILRVSTWVGNNFLGYIFNFFGLLAQRITVREPEERHTRAALAALNTVLELENGERNGS